MPEVALVVAAAAAAAAVAAVLGPSVVWPSRLSKQAVDSLFDNQQYSRKKPEEAAATTVVFLGESIERTIEILVQCINKQARAAATPPFVTSAYKCRFTHKVQTRARRPC